MKKLKDVLGLDVYCEPQWQILVSELESFWEDKGELVSSVASFVHVWFEALTELLDDEAHEAWTDTVLTNIREVTSRLNLTVEVCCSLSSGVQSWLTWYIAGIRESTAFNQVV